MTFQIYKKETKKWKNLDQVGNFQNYYYWIYQQNFLQKKISNEQFNIFEAKISLVEVIKSINYQTNNKSSWNDGLIAEFYKHISNELASLFLDVYDS